MKTDLPNSSIYFHSRAYKELHLLLKNQNLSSVFILVDENTRLYCLQHFLQQLETHLPVEIIERKAGENHKTLQACSKIWKTLSESGADRKSLLINLGGGVITDLGGFAASVYKRGICFVHVPTSLLAMTDAAIGGKNGVNLGHLKNHIGTIQVPKLILIDPNFLETLPENQLKSGFAEMLKHGLIFRKSYWEKMGGFSTLNLMDLKNLIRESVEIKTKIVAQDPHENGYRKILNFGHTLGHAIESYFLSNPGKTNLLHGEAIAAGMIMEGFISSEIRGFPKKSLHEMKKKILLHFKTIDFQKADYEPILKLLEHDKKNTYGKINFVLLNAIGKPQIDCQVENKLISAAFGYYSS